MTRTQKPEITPLLILGWTAATILLLIGMWLAIALPLIAAVFSQIVPGVIALIAGLGVIVALRHHLD